MAHLTGKIGLLLATVLWLLPIVPHAQTLDDAHGCLARARLATGGAAWGKVHVLHAHMTLRAGGLEGERDSWTEAAQSRYAEHYTIGPDAGGEVWNGRAAWTTDGAGRVHDIDKQALPGLRTKAFWESFAFLFDDVPAELLERRREAGRGFQVLRLTPPGARPFELWLDADTGLPARIVVPGEQDIVVTFADYRVTNGLKLPFLVSVSDGLPRDAQIMIRGSIEVDPPLGVDPFTMPAPSPPDYSFENGDRRSTTELTSTGSAFLVDVTIDGHGPFPFVLDTGTRNAIDASLAQELGMDVVGTFRGRGAGEEPVDVGLTRIGDLKIGGIRLRQQVFRVLPLSQLAAGAKVRYRGLLGFEIFDRFVVRVDQDRHEVTLSEPASWSYRGDAKPVSFRFHGNLPVVQGSIDKVAGRFSLDTGQANSLTLYRPFLIRMGIERKYPPKLNIIVGEGIGGPIRAEVARGQHLLIGNASVTWPMLYLSLQKSGAFNDPELAGNIGAGVFLRFNTTFDYANKQIYFEHATAYGEADSLMTVKRVFNGLKVLNVVPGSPMADAGLEADDVIEMINSRDALRMDYDEVQRLFRRPAGTRIPMTVRSDGKVKDIIVILSQLI
jgi:hypothetical protein